MGSGAIFARKRLERRSRSIPYAARIMASPQAINRDDLVHMKKKDKSPKPMYAQFAIETKDTRQKPVQLAPTITTPANNRVRCSVFRKTLHLHLKRKSLPSFNKRCRVLSPGRPSSLHPTNQDACVGTLDTPLQERARMMRGGHCRRRGLGKDSSRKRDPTPALHRRGGAFARKAHPPQR